MGEKNLNRTTSRPGEQWAQKGCLSSVENRGRYQRNHEDSLCK